MAEQFIASKQLPYVLQSTKLKNFFDSTVDQWFKNENSIFEKGFVGQRQGRVLNTTKDSYLAEPTVDRLNYQLEPAAIVRNAAAQDISYQTTYSDIINKIRFDGGNNKDHSRLFESKYYSFGPPIDFDKYLNYSNYYWYPTNDDLSTETAGAFTSLPEKSIDGTTTQSITLPSDIVGKKTYTAPDGTVFTNGLHIRFEGSHINGTAYQYYYTVDSMIITNPGSNYAVGDAINIGSKTVGKVSAVNSGAITSVEITEKQLNDGDLPSTVTIISSSGQNGIVTINTTRNSISFVIEGVGTEIRLVDTRTLKNVGNSVTATKDYITIERGARDGNLWSKSNGWVHKDTLSSYPSVTTQSQTDQQWDADPWDITAFDIQLTSATTAFTTTSARRALRPIVEFKRGIELYNYGTNHLADVTVVEPLLSKTQIEGLSSVTIDGYSIQNQDTILFTNAASQDDYVQWDSDLWDHDIDSDPATGGGGGTGGDLGWDVSSTTFSVGASIWKVSGVGTSIVLTQLTTNVNTNDKVYIENGNIYNGTEWYYDGYNWKQAQAKTQSNQAPLYNLYDENKNLLNNNEEYPSSTFIGSKIFGYKVGTLSNDIELGFPLAYSSGNDRSDIQFSNFLNEDIFTYDDGEISGYKYYKQNIYPQTISKTFDYEVNVNPSNVHTDKNIYFINGEEAPALILVRGNTYNFKFSSPESSSQGYTGENHSFYISTGTAWSPGAYTGEYTGGVTGSRAYYGGASSTLKFTVPSNAPDTLYYHCGIHNSMGNKLVIVDNPITTLDEATETNYYNEWFTDPTKKLKQRLIQEHTVSNRNIDTPVVLEVLPTSVLDIEVYKNGDKLNFGTDYTLESSVLFNFTTPLVQKDFIKIYYKTNDPNPIRSTNYFEIPKNLENNASNEDVSTVTYSELFEHFKSTIGNQKGFTGSINGTNNYRDTAQDLSLGSVILQHDAPLLKAMAITNNQNLDIPEAIRFSKDRYQEFQLKFLSAVNNIQNSQESLTLSTAQIVDKALTNLNATKSLGDPFTYSNLIASGDRYVAESHTITVSNYTWGVQTASLSSLSITSNDVFNTEPGLIISSAFDLDTDFNSKVLYIYKNNVQMVVNHDYIVDSGSQGTKVIFLGAVSQKPQIGDVITVRFYESIQPTWIPHTPASLGIGKVYKPQEFTDSTTYSSGTRHFIQCHDGSLVLKYNDQRDTALLELEKRIYNTMYYKISNQNSESMYSVESIIPNKFNSTSWSRKEINDLMQPIFTRWANDNAVNYQENTGYSQIITLSPNNNYVVTDYVASGYMETAGNQSFIVGEEIQGANSGAKAKIISVSQDTNTITVNNIIDEFDINEVLLGSKSGVGRKLATVNVDWKVLNYSSLVDQDGESLPGHWRGIYRWYYGTDRPHTHPWEMLGFSQKPLWWDQYYTWTSPSIRTQLISDIEQGIIRSGARENYSDRSYLSNNNVYKKPGFSSYVPVNSNGELLSPLDVGIISANPTELPSQADWKFGDGAPVEHAFVTSVAYQYALQQLLYVTTPGLYVEQLWDVLDTIKSTINENQSISKTTGKRSTNKNYYVHSESDVSLNRYLRSGVQNFISDYILYQGNEISETFGEVIRNIQANLMYRCAGYIDTTKLKIESEAYDSTSRSTNIIIPAEDTNVTLYTGASIQEASYSAIIVELVDGGYKVYGYDTARPYFIIYQPLPNSSSSLVRVGGKDISPSEYNAGVTYHKDEVISFGGIFYQCTVPHTSLSTQSSPELSYWKKISKLPQQGGTEVRNYNQYDYSQSVNIDYGTVFKTRQEVYDIIKGYGQYLSLQGWTFDDYNSDLGQTMDWDYSAKEFLFWSLGKWQINDFVTLSPSASVLKFKPISGVVQSLTDIVNGTYSALNKQGYGLDTSQLQVNRNSDGVEVFHKQNIGIYGLRLYVKETEHAITLNNSTIFNDTIYNTLLAQRQPRVKISTVKTLDWNGKLEADGFIVNGTSLINNFEKSVKDTLEFYDVDAEKVDTDFRNAAMHVIGYQERDYLTNLGISKRNQVKLYQGMVKQKGTTNAIDRLLRSTTVSTDQTFDTYEEWAFKVGEFGSTNFNQQIELRLKAQDVVTDPLLFEFILPTDGTTTSGYDATTDEIVTIDIDDTARWLKKPTGEKTLANLWPTSSTVDSNIPTAGYVHWNDSTYQAYDSTALDNLYGSQSGEIALGSTAWVAKDVDGGKDWNIYKLRNTGTKIDNVVSNGDANTAMKVTLSGTTVGATSGDNQKFIIHKTYDSNGTLVIDPTIWGTHTLTFKPTTPTAPTLTIAFSDAVGSGASLAVGNIAGSVTNVTSTGGSGFAVGDVITFTGTTGSGASAIVQTVNAGEPTSLTLNSGGANYSAAPNGFTVTDSSGTAKVLGTDYTAPTFTFTGSGTGGVFGEILDLVITNGGTNYQSPKIIITRSDGSVVEITSSNITLNSGVITAITVPSNASQPNNQKFSSGITSTATGSITIYDTATGYEETFNSQLAKVFNKAGTMTLTANVTSAWSQKSGASNPTVTVSHSTDNSTWTPFTLSAPVDLTTAGTTDIVLSALPTDNANVYVKASLTVTDATAGNVTFSLNYSSREYEITKLDGTNEYVTTVDNTTINDPAVGIPLLDWEDVRLNNQLDTVETTVAGTLNTFLTGINSNVTWSDGDLIWLDNDSTGKWGVYRFTSNVAIKNTYNNIRGTEPEAEQDPILLGTNYWILHSDVDYDDSTKTIEQQQGHFANTKRRQSDKVVTSQFEQAVLYDDRTNKVNLVLTPYDPAKGILPPTADREIKFKSEIDPAVYDYHSDINQMSTSKPWQDEHIGDVWWDLSTVRYIDYESHDNAYRRTYWGRLFPGATVDIYEWVSSKTPPASYTGTGTVKSTTEYSTKTETNDSTSVSITTYYFWVKNVSAVPAIQGRNNNTITVSKLITSPIAQGLNYFAPVSQNAISIANVLNFTTKQNTVLQLNYRKRNTNDKTNSKHAQWLLIKEDYPSAPIPDQIWNKMIDSLLGFDKLGNTVPDMSLSEHDRYGNQVRPRQSWFIDSKTARKIFHQSLNSITTKINLDVNHFGWDIDLTTANYYEKTNWYYNTSYNDETIIDKIVDYYSEIDTSLLVKDEIIKVNYGYNSKWELWQYTDVDFLSGTTTTYDESNLSLVRIGLQTATAKLKTNVYTEEDSTAMDTELRAYIKALKDNVLIAQNLKFQNELLFAMIRYVNSEQTHVDWLFKSTYLNVIQQDTALTQKASFEKDPFNDVKSYIEEVKPYRSKIRNFLSKKSPVREDADMAMSDFTGDSDYTLDPNTLENTNPTPKINTKLVFDRVSTTITKVDNTESTEGNWTLGIGYSEGTKVKYNGGFWQCTTTHTPPTVGGGISGYTLANPVVVTTNSAHGLSNNDVVTIANVLGTASSGTADSEINGVHRISNVTLTTFEIATVDSSNFLPFNSNGLVSTTTFVNDAQNGKWQRIPYTMSAEASDVDKINRIISTTPIIDTHVDRLAKYYYATELAALDVTDATAVSSFMNTLSNKIGYYKDLDVQPIGFKVNRDRIGQELENFAWDSLQWDYNAVGTNPQLGFDATTEALQQWYDSKFTSSTIWKNNTTYTKNTFVKHNDLAHLDEWNVATSYTVGDIVKHNNEIYVANVTHKNLAVGINKLGSKDGVDENNFVPSRWDLIRDRIYYTNDEHTSSTQFETDYDAGKWILVQAQLDSAGFARPSNDPYPEEVIPFTPKESLLITVKTNDGVTGSGTNSDPYVGTGDFTQYKIYYSPYGQTEYLRDKFVDDGTTDSTDDHTTLNGEITKSSNTITVTDASKLPAPGGDANEPNNLQNNKPGAVWIGSERIEYSRIDGNVLSDIVRGTHGTTIQDHATGIDVYSANTYIPGGKEVGFWNSTATTLLDSTTIQATYLKNGGNIDSDFDYTQADYVDPDYV